MRGRTRKEGRSGVCIAMVLARVEDGCGPHGCEAHDKRLIIIVDPGDSIRLHIRNVGVSREVFLDHMLSRAVPTTVPGFYRTPVSPAHEFLYTPRVTAAILPLPTNKSVCTPLVARFTASAYVLPAVKKSHARNTRERDLAHFHASGSRSASPETTVRIRASAQTAAGLCCRAHTNHGDQDPSAPRAPWPLPFHDRGR